MSPPPPPRPSGRPSSSGTTICSRNDPRSPYFNHLIFRGADLRATRAVMAAGGWMRSPLTPFCSQDVSHPTCDLKVPSNDISCQKKEPKIPTVSPVSTLFPSLTHYCVSVASWRRLRLQMSAQETGSDPKPTPAEASGAADPPSVAPLTYEPGTHADPCASSRGPACY